MGLQKNIKMEYVKAGNNLIPKKEADKILNMPRMGKSKVTKMKTIKEIRKYLNKLIRHLGHHCCAIDTKEHNRILALLYDLEKDTLKDVIKLIDEIIKQGYVNIYHIKELKARIEGK